MNIKNLSARLKQKYLPFLLKRDNGFKCFYCNIDLISNYIFEHLDNNRQNNQSENIVLACQSCNNKKTYSNDMKNKAREKINENKRCNLTCAREREVQAPTFNANMDANQENFEITHQYIEEMIVTENFIEYKDALDSATMQCKNKTNTGSQIAVRRYLDALCSSIGPYMIIKNENKKRVVVRRKIDE